LLRKGRDKAVQAGLVFFDLSKKMFGELLAGVVAVRQIRAQFFNRFCV